MADDTPEEQAKINEENHHKCVDRFVELANALKDEGLEPRLVSHALMSASGIYATYAIAGNANGLNQAGVERLTEIYQANLENIQRSKREQSRDK